MMDTQSPDFTVRNLHFSFDDSIPRHWHGGNAVRTALFNSQSLFFPAGERFFVDSVRAFIPKLGDTRLRRQARLFCGQEAIHQREHVKYNRMLERQGYPAVRMERAVGLFLALVTRITFARQRLAITCALEHFTASGANDALTEAQLLEGAHPAMAAFWRWHAGEETEHKSVPFDVHQAVGGTHLERVLFMFFTTITFQVYSYLHLLRFLWIDRSLFSWSAWRAVLHMTPGGTPARFLRRYLAYYRRGFHPSQLDARAALGAFERELSDSSVFAAAASRDAHAPIAETAA